MFYGLQNILGYIVMFNFENNPNINSIVDISAPNTCLASKWWCRGKIHVFILQKPEVPD